MPTIVHSMFAGTGMYSGRQDLQKFYYTNSLRPKIVEAIRKVADEVRNANLFSIAPTGAFIDAQTFNQTMTSLQKQTIETLIKETPGDQICRFGTLATSLAQSGDKARVAQLGLSSKMMQRELLRSGLIVGIESGIGSKMGRTNDKAARYDQYTKVFCDPTDSNGAVAGLPCTTPDLNRNSDIDITKVLFNPLTLNLNFTAITSTPTADEQNIFALSNNLFANNLPVNLNQSDFDAIANGDAGEADGRKEKLTDYRSLIAKRTVAQNSFAAIAAMKASGSGGSSAYMKQMVSYLGLTDAADQTAFIGNNPSYYAQMELLTRKIYQSPAFYANLMESPANVARQQAAMEGIGLMQDRDIYKSLQRSEMVMSTLLEMYIQQEQDDNKDRGAK